MSILYDQKRVFTYIYNTTGGGTIFSSNFVDSTVFDYFSDSAVVDDAVYFLVGEGSRYRWHELTLYVGTALVGTLSLVWEYYASDNTWKQLTVSDGTNGLTILGENVVSFVAPTDWARSSVNGHTGTAIRCRITSLTSITEGGAQSTQVANHKDRGITVVGYTETSPCTLEDIYQTDVANGWGICKKNSSYQYKILTNLFIGDSSSAQNHVLNPLNTPTWFSVQSTALEVGGYWEPFCSGGKAMFGTLVDSATKNTINGSYFKLSHEDNPINTFRYIGGTDTYLYGTTVIGFIYDGYVSDVINSYLEGATDLMLHNDSNIMYRTTLTNSGTGNGLMARSSATYDDIAIVGALAGVRLWVAGVAKPVFTFANLKITGTTYLVAFNGTTVTTNQTVVLIDVVTNTYVCYWTKLFSLCSVLLKNTITLHIVDKNNIGVQNANVELYDKNGFVFSVSTDSDGYIIKQTILVATFKNNGTVGAGGTVIYNNNPFILKISKSGYKSYKTEITIDNKIEWEIMLSKVLDTNISTRVSFNTQ